MSVPRIITWLDDLCYDHNLFPSSSTVFFFRSDSMSTNKTRGGGVLIVLSPEVRSCKRRYNSEICDGSLWVEMHILGSLNLLIFNRYFPLPR
jgi:hypothetical protein